MDINRKIQMLKRFAIFKASSDSDLEKIAKETELTLLKEEKTIFKEGDYGESFFAISVGKVDFYKKAAATGREVLVNTLEGGDFFGELAYFNKTKRRLLTAKAYRQTMLFEIPHRFLGLLQQSEEVVVDGLVQAMETKKEQYHSKILELAPQAGDSVGSEIFSFEQEIDLKKENLYSLKLVCPACREEITTLRALSRHVKIIRTDSDFCRYYDGVNPLLYEITVCSVCSYGFTKNKPAPLPAEKMGLLQPVLATLLPKNYSLLRDVQMSIEAFEIALQCQVALESKKALLARLNLRLAWMYRYQDNQVAERKYLQAALENYREVFSVENSSLKEELRLIYLIGELYNRLDDQHQAVNWFNKAVMHPHKKQFPLMVEKARDRWQDIRAEIILKK